jgi:hypothetical protein
MAESLIRDVLNVLNVFNPFTLPNMLKKKDKLSALTVLKNVDVVVENHSKENTQYFQVESR